MEGCNLGCGLASVEPLPRLEVWLTKLRTADPGECMDHVGDILRAQLRNPAQDTTPRWMEFFDLPSQTNLVDFTA